MSASRLGAAVAAAISSLGLFGPRVSPRQDEAGPPHPRAGLSLLDEEQELEEEIGDGERFGSQLVSLDPTTRPALPLQYLALPRRLAVEMAYGDDTYIYGFAVYLAAMHAAVVWWCCGRRHPRTTFGRFRSARVISTRATPSW